MSDPPDDAKQGTGHEFARIDLGQLGELVIEDDGCHDPDVDLRIDGIDDVRHIHRHFRKCREELGDQEFEVRLRDAIEKSGVAPTRDQTETTYNSGPFVCDDCHKTWPRKHDQTPNKSETICPECHS